jgi:hypothetical protein
MTAPEKPKPISVKARKAKARGVQNTVRDDVRAMYFLSEHDVKAAQMGSKGADLQLSEEARRHFPFAVECKCQNALNIWESLDQADGYAKADPSNPAPLLVFKRDRTAIYVALKWDDFKRILANRK